MLIIRPDKPATNMQPRYNIAPTTTVDAVLMGEGGRELMPMRWSIIPGWWKKPLKELPSTFNARAETIPESPMFRSAFKSRRCIIPVSGFYEWTASPEGRQPHYISDAGGSILPAAGLWDEWLNPETGERVVSCTIITTTSNAFMRPIHNRMPALLLADVIDDWLHCKSGREVLRPVPDNYLQEWLVSRRVNAAGKVDDATLIEPLTA